MYRSIKAGFTLCAAFLAAILSSCAQIGGPAGGQESRARVEIGFPCVSQAALDAASQLTQGRRSFGRARPFFRATRIEIRLKDSTGAVADSAVLQPDSALGDTVLTFFSIAPGSYALEADIYNSACPGNSPIASGASGSFAVEAGNTASVSIACLPVDPEPLEAGTESPAIDLTPYLFDLASGAIDYREEKWLSFTASGPTIMAATPRDPARAGYYLAVYDRSGVLVGSLDGKNSVAPDGSVALSLALNQGERYYIGCVSYGMYGTESRPSVLPAVFTLSARPDLISSLSVSSASVYILSSFMDCRNSAATLLEGSTLSIRADSRYPGESLCVDGTYRAFGSPIELAIGEGQESVSVVATDAQGHADERRIWVTRATALIAGQRAIGTSLRGEDIFFYMPVDPGAGYTAEWTEAQHNGSFSLTARISAFDEDGWQYIADEASPFPRGLTTTADASCLIIRARPFYPGFGGNLGLTVTPDQGGGGEGEAAGSGRLSASRRP